MNKKIRAIGIFTCFFVVPAIAGAAHKCVSKNGEISITQLACLPGQTQQVFTYRNGLSVVPSSPSKTYTGDLMTAHFDDIDIRIFLSMLADFSGLNIVATESVKGTTTVHFNNTPWDQVLDYILMNKGLSSKLEGNKLYIGLPIEMQVLK